MAVECRSCGNTNVARLEMIWKQQSGSFEAVSAGYSTGGGLGVSGTSGRQRSRLASEARPPERRSIVRWVVWMLISAIYPAIQIPAAANAVAQAQWDSSQAAAAIAVSLVIAGLVWLLCVVKLVLHARFNLHRLPALQQSWASTWQCLACGARFT